MPKKTKSVSIHVVPFLRGLKWDIKVDGRPIGGAVLQADAEANAIFLAKRMVAASVRAHKGNGKIKWERTFPRSADPKETEG